MKPWPLTPLRSRNGRQRESPAVGRVEPVAAWRNSTGGPPTAVARSARWPHARTASSVAGSPVTGPDAAAMRKIGNVVQNSLP